MENHMGKLASEQLELGAVYSREDLRTLLEIHDSTINNGIFHPKGYYSV
jgi:putative restriction endonuclease